MPHKVIKTARVLGLQGYVNFYRMNPVEITLDLNEVVEELSKYKKFKHRFLVENLLFSSSLQNETDIIFIKCNRLSDARKALINSKLYKTLGVVYLSEVKDWKLVKGESKRWQTVFVDSEYNTKSSHYAFAFSTKNILDLYNFTITLLDGTGNKITFPSSETKVPMFGFKIQIIK